MREICKTLGVARSNVLDRLNKEAMPRAKRYSKKDDPFFLVLIKEIMRERTTYGYRRVTAKLNAKLKGLEKAVVNHKRVYRIMREGGLLQKRGIPKFDRLHQGRIITLKSNLRWCSDCFELKCWSGERLRVAFALDCCDREIIGYVSSRKPIKASDIQELLIDSVEKRFGGSLTLPHPIEWLSDNGMCYVANETVRVVRSLGFKVCTTPSRSPESNGMAESFVKTFKRDYAYVNDLTDALVVEAKLAQWFEDYNEEAPHKGLKMMSPRQFRRAQFANG